ncbi:MAG: cytochrome c biogenesis protein ResB, partial [Planctomycetota bacterium]
ILSFKKDGGFACFKGPKKLEKYGFYTLHLSILVLLAGGFTGTAMKLTGYIALTEGQTFVEDHNNYMRLAEGPLRRENHKGFALKLEKIETEYERGFYQTDFTAHLDVLEEGEKVLRGAVKVNYPFNYKSLAFTYQDIGFSPRIEIKDKNTGRVLFYSFVMLKTFGTPEGKLYRDYLPLPFLKERTIVTVYPSYEMVDREPVKTSEEPDKPLIRIEVENDAREVVSKAHIPLGQSTTVGEHIIKFTDLRRWVSFEVVEDPGYLTVCVAFWLGLAALVLRYIPDLRKWFGPHPEPKRD